MGDREVPSSCALYASLRSSRLREVGVGWPPLALSQLTRPGGVGGAGDSSILTLNVADVPPSDVCPETFVIL